MTTFPDRMGSDGISGGAGDALPGPGSSQVEPQAGLDASHSIPIASPRGIDFLAAENADLKRDLSKAKRMYEIARANLDRWVPCPGHRDKTVRGLCLLCALERMESALERGSYSFAAKIVGEALGRQHVPAQAPEGNAP